MKLERDGGCRACLVAAGSRGRTVVVAARLYPGEPSVVSRFVPVIAQREYGEYREHENGLHLP